MARTATNGKLNLTTEEVAALEEIASNKKHRAKRVAEALLSYEAGADRSAIARRAAVGNNTIQSWASKFRSGGRIGSTILMAKRPLIGFAARPDLIYPLKMKAERDQARREQQEAKDAVTIRPIHPASGFDPADFCCVAYAM